MTNVFLTRAPNEIAETSLVLREKGFTPLACPLFDVAFPPLPPVDPEAYQGLLVTSRNGVRALAARPALRTLPLIVVGEQTALLAKESGFLKVIDGGGTVPDLLRQVVTTLNPERKPLLYPRGQIIRHDLKGALAQKGFCVEEKIVYRLTERRQLPPFMLESAATKTLWAGLFFSQHAAAHFKRLVDKTGLRCLFGGVYFFGLSSFVLEPLIGWGRACLAPRRPRVDQLIDLLCAVENGDHDRKKEGK